MHQLDADPASVEPLFPSETGGYEGETGRRMDRHDVFQSAGMEAQCKALRASFYRCWRTAERPPRKSAQPSGTTGGGDGAFLRPASERNGRGTKVKLPWSLSRRASRTRRPNEAIQALRRTRRRNGPKSARRFRNGTRPIAGRLWQCGVYRWFG